MAPHFHQKSPNSFRKINIYRPLLDILIKDPLEFIPSQRCFDITESYKIRMLSQLLRSIPGSCVVFLPRDEIKEDNCSKPSQDAKRLTKTEIPLELRFLPTPVCEHSA